MREEISQARRKVGGSEGGPAWVEAVVVRLLSRLDRWSTERVWVVSGLMVPAIGGLSYVTGPELSCSLLFLIPVLLVSRVAGFGMGVAMACWAASIWFAADLAAVWRGEADFEHGVTPYWNVLMRLGTFVVAAALVAAMQSLNRQLEVRVQERTADLEEQVAEKRDLERRILEVGDRERALIGQDLHDGLCQQLVSASFSAAILEDEWGGSSSREGRKVARLGGLIDDAITQARDLARGLYPVRLEAEGLEMALRELAGVVSKRFGVDCRVDDGGWEVLEEVEGSIHLYRIAQEAATNAAKHSGGKKIRIRAEGRSLVIEDDGNGIAEEGWAVKGMGMRSMAYRARMMGAELEVGEAVGGGVRVACGMRAEKGEVGDE